MSGFDLDTHVRLLAADRRHGAAELARHALSCLAEAAATVPATDPAALRTALAQAADALAAARPAMAPLHNLLARWRRSLDALPDTDLETLRTAAAEGAHGVIADAQRAAHLVVANAVEEIGYGRTVVTHSYSSTVAAVLHGLRDRAVSVVFTEARPLCEGHRLAERLSQWHVPSTLITDAQLALAVAEADLALVGADSLLRDGAVVNKAGTALLALAAREQGIPFYVCAETFKQRADDDAEPPQETMDTRELGAPGWPRVELRNAYFDITPAHLVSAWVNERGVEPVSGGADGENT